MFKNYLIAACYDGNIYIFNTKNDDNAVNICGPANMLLAMDLWDNKVSKTFRLIHSRLKLFPSTDYCVNEGQNIENHEHPNVKSNNLYESLM